MIRKPLLQTGFYLLLEGLILIEICFGLKSYDVDNREPGGFHGAGSLTRFGR